MINLFERGGGEWKLYLVTRSAALCKKGLIDWLIDYFKAYQPFFRLFNANFCWFDCLASCKQMEYWRFKFFYIDQLLLEMLAFCLLWHVQIFLSYCLQYRNIVFLVLGRCNLSIGVLLNMKCDVPNTTVVVLVCVDMSGWCLCVRYIDKIG